MELRVLKASILSNSIPRFLIFNVKEPTLAKQYIESISNSINKQYKYYDTAESVIYDIDSNIKEDYLYVIFNDDNLSEAIIDKLISSGRNVIIYLGNISGFDKRLNVLKKYTSYIVDFNKIDFNTLIAYVQKVLRDAKITVDQDKIIKLIECCDCDLGAILNELDKIIILEQANSNVLFDYMQKNGFSDYRHLNVYNFVNKIVSRDKTVLSDLVKFEDSPVTLLTILYNTSKSRFLQTRQRYYVELMKSCVRYHKAILDGSVSDEYVIKLLVYEVMFI